VSGSVFSNLQSPKKSIAMNFFNLKHLPVLPALMAALIIFVLLLNIYTLLAY